MQQGDALDEVQRTENQQVILAIASLCHEPIQRANQTHGNVPLESLLQLEKLSKSRVLGELGKIFAGS